MLQAASVDAVDREGHMRFLRRTGLAPTPLAPESLALMEGDDAGLEATRLGEAETHDHLRLIYLEAESDFAVRAVAASLPDATAAEWAGAAAAAIDWYRYAATGDRADSTAFCLAVQDALETHADGPRVMILRDYHAENLLWLPGRKGVARVGLLDFQLSQMGQPAYDLVSLCQDARRDVSRVTEDAAVRQFMDETGIRELDFAPGYAALGAQRALRILGVFARLCLVTGKPGYVALIPRVWSQLQRNLAHPALAGLSAICAALLPEPTEARLDRIRNQCARRVRISSNLAHCYYKCLTDYFSHDILRYTIFMDRGGRVKSPEREAPRKKDFSTDNLRS
jgi:hypothetical protein